MATVRIPLNSRKHPGHFAFIDEMDFPVISAYLWHVAEGNRTLYAETNMPKPDGGYRSLLMHRLLMGEPDHLEVDHANRNGLDNRRGVNLRVCTSEQNKRNVGPLNSNTTGYRGVTHHTTGVWRARIGTGKRGERLIIGNYATAEEAARAYDAKARAMWGDFAWLNFPGAFPPAPTGDEPIRYTGRTKFHGIRFHRNARGKKWSAAIKYQGVNIPLKCHATAEEAARAYDAKARELLGAGAWLNFPDEV